MSRLCCLAALAVLAGCGSEPPEVECGATPVRYGSVTALQQCVPCHDSRLDGAERQGAPDDVNYDTPEAAAAAASAGADEVASGTMPPDAFPITENQRDRFYSWALCGAAE